MRAHKYSDTDPLIDPATGQLDPVEFRRRLKGWLAVLVAFAILFGGVGFVATKGFEAYSSFKTAKDFPGPPTDEVELIIPKNSTALQIGKILVDAGVVKDAKKFQDTAMTRPDLWGKVQAGKYRIDRGIPSLMALQELVDPTRAVHNWMQLREAQRLDPQLIAAMAAGTKISKEEVMAYFTTTKPADARLPAWATSPVASDLTTVQSWEGLVFPDNYDIPDSPKVSDVVRLSSAQFTAVTSKLDFYNVAQNLDFGPQYKTATANQKAYLALVVASIIDREVFRAEDRPRVARVIYNRLAAGMPLQLDSTVAYSVKKTDTIWTSDADRSAANKSPYNTYIAKGLPPTPISSPAEAAMSAAINPEAGDWLYFMPVNLDTGQTEFSKDVTAHNAAVAQLQTWCAASEANKKKCS